jgi:NAD-dependent deacetylase
MKRNLVVFTGAGISASSGLATFRGANGLWEGYKIEEVATPEAWHKNPHLVTAFYNERRLSVAKAAPNLAHLQLKELESEWNVVIITQNIDDLHERAGSKNVLHLHGEIMKMRSQRDENLLYDVDVNKLSMTLEDKCPFGLPWRPSCCLVW